MIKLKRKTNEKEAIVEKKNYKHFSFVSCLNCYCCCFLHLFLLLFVVNTKFLRD